MKVNIHLSPVETGKSEVLFALARHRTQGNNRFNFPRTLYHTCAFAEPRSEDSVCILEHAIFQTNDDKLAAFKPRLYKPPDILGVREIKGRVNLVQDVHRCWLMKGSVFVNDGGLRHLLTLNCRRAIIRERAISELRKSARSFYAQHFTYRCPPDNSVNDCFQTFPKHTLTSRPSLIVLFSGGSSFAKLPGRSSAKI